MRKAPDCTELTAVASRSSGVSKVGVYVRCVFNFFSFFPSGPSGNLLGVPHQMPLFSGLDPGARDTSKHWAAVGMVTLYPFHLYFFQFPVLMTHN